MAASGSEFITLENMAGIVDSTIENLGGSISFPKYYWYGQWKSGVEGATISGLMYNGITSGIYNYDDNMRTLTFTVDNPGIYRITYIELANETGTSLFAIYFPEDLNTRVMLNEGRACYIAITSSNQQFKLSTGGRSQPIVIEYVGAIGSDADNYVNYMSLMNDLDFKILNQRGSVITVGEPTKLGHRYAIPFTFQKNGVYGFYGNGNFEVQSGSAYQTVTIYGNPALFRVDSAPQTVYCSIGNSNYYGVAVVVAALSLD